MHPERASFLTRQPLEERPASRMQRRGADIFLPFKTSKKQQNYAPTPNERTQTPSIIYPLPTQDNRSAAELSDGENILNKLQ